MVQLDESLAKLSSCFTQPLAGDVVHVVVQPPKLGECETLNPLQQWSLTRFDEDAPADKPSHDIVLRALYNEANSMYRPCILFHALKTVDFQDKVISFRP
jgi:hypothetical protein